MKIFLSSALAVVVSVWSVLLTVLALVLSGLGAFLLLIAGLLFNRIPRA